jgi:hypothetical protein
MIEDNRNPLQLRALQSLADSAGNTRVSGLPYGTLPLRKWTGKKNASECKMEKDEE